jgi:hypothetical protein
MKMQSTESLMKGVFRANPRFSVVFKFFAFLGLVVMLVVVGSTLSIFIWLETLDQRGTFHNTTDLADLDADGDLDVVLHNVRNESETVAFSQTTLWINQGGGQFSAESIQFPPYLYLSAATGDVDADQDVDLIFLAAHQLMIFLNQGNAQGGETGEFIHSRAVKPTGNIGTPGSLVLDDLNNNGALDGFVAGCCGMDLSSIAEQIGSEDYLPSISWVWINQRYLGGSFGNKTLSLVELDDLPIRATDLGDLDGDGDLDIFAAVQVPKPGRDSLPADLVLLNDGSGSFTDSGQRLGDTDSSSVALGDMDSDGDLDALVGTREGVLVWVNQGGAQGGQAGYFWPSMQEITGKQTGAVFLADLDGDGDQDALIAGIRKGAIWWNDGLGTFTLSDQRFRYSNRHGFAIGDFNGDGWLDIFAGDYSRAYNVWINQGDGTFQAAR